MSDIASKIAPPSDYSDEALIYNTAGTLRKVVAEIERLKADVDTFTAAVDYLTADYTRCCSEKEAFKAEVERKDAALKCGVRAAKLGLFLINKYGVMPNDSWKAGFNKDLAAAEAALTQEKKAAELGITLENPATALTSQETQNDQA
jgi:hypothetical protein